MASAHQNPAPASGLPFSRCVVARGRSGRVETRFEGPDPMTYQVGASRQSDWWLEGRDTPARALDLHWDGELLWAADRTGHGEATIDGEQLGRRWRGLAGHCRIEFPGVALVVECSRPGVVIEEVPRGAPADAVPLMSEVREVLQPPSDGADELLILEPVVGLPALPAPLVDEPTRSWQSGGSAAARARRQNRPLREAIVPPPAESTTGAHVHDTLPGVGVAGLPGMLQSRVESAGASVLASSADAHAARLTPILADEPTPTQPGRRPVM